MRGPICSKALNFKLQLVFKLGLVCDVGVAILHPIVGVVPLISISTVPILAGISKVLQVILIEVIVPEQGCAIPNPSVTPSPKLYWSPSLASTIFSVVSPQNVALGIPQSLSGFTVPVRLTLPIIPKLLFGLVVPMPTLPKTIKSWEALMKVKFLPVPSKSDDKLPNLYPVEA